jgi:stress-induced-phosphoprotein 1
MSVDELKAKGNKFFAAGKFEEAVAQFTQALAIDAENTAVLSNRSAAYIRWGANDTAKYELAVADAEQCITLAPGWEKGYSRLASAQMAQCKFKEAVQTYVKGIGADPANKLL